MANSYRKIIFQIFLVSIGSSFCFAQLAGTYTVGGANADYESPLAALQSVADFGASDTVIFNINDGVYIGDIDVDYLQSEYPIIVRSVNSIAENVTLESTGNYFIIGFTKNLFFEHLTFDFSQGLDGLVFSGQVNLGFDSCIFITNGSSYAYCLKIQTGGYASNIYLKGNTFQNGTVNVACGYNGEGIVEENFFSDDAHFHGGFDTLRSNTFTRTVFLDYANQPTPLVFENNTVLEGYGVSSSFGSNFVMANNTITGNVSFGFTDDVVFYGNDLYGYLSLSNGEGYLVYNNYFHDNVHISPNYGSITRIYFNNFGPESYLSLRDIYTLSSVMNNNFSQPIIWAFWPENTATIKVINNNYWPGTGTSGVEEFNIDPQYVSDSILRATNPHLSGIGLALNYFVANDIDGNPRSTLTTIGPHEFCSDADTLVITCGSKVGTHLCSLEGVSDFTIEPAEWVEFENSPYPRLKPTSSTMFYFHSLNGVLLDSLFVEVNPFQFSLFEDVTINCGYLTYLYNSVLPIDNTTITWTPNDGTVFQWSDYLYYAKPDTTTTYIAELNYEGCGIHTDSITVSVNQIPVAAFNYDWNPPYDSTIYFYSNTFCVDSVFWDFGDGTTSTSIEFNPVHIYAVSDYYWVKLTAFNNAGLSDTDSILVNANFIVTDVPSELQKGQHLLYPNPTSGKCYLKIDKLSDVILTIYSLDGKQVMQKKEHTSKQVAMIEIDISTLDSGTYLLQVLNDNETYTYRVVKN